MSPAGLPPNSIRLWHQDTPDDRKLYPVVLNERMPRTQTATWAIRVVDGPTSADSEQLMSSWTQDDYSGGFGVQDANESVDSSRYDFGIIDSRRPKKLVLPPLTSTPAKPAAATGSAYPLGDVGTQFYVGWGNNIYGWKHSDNTWHTTANAWPANFVPLAKGVQFCGGLFIPGGAQGFVRLSELTAASGTLTIAQNTDIDAVRFGLHDGKLWAIDTANKIWQLTTVGAALGATTTANWGKTDAVGGTTGLNEKDPIGNDFILDTSVTPTRLINYVNAAQEESLWCITRGKGAYLMNPDEPRWIKSSVKEGMHPDWGIAAEVFRDGEDLWIVGGGLDITRFTTANVEVPLSGPNKDQGVPPAYWGTIVDLCAERSTLYGLVSAGTSLAAGAPANQWVMQQTLTTFNGLALSNPAQVATDSEESVFIADTGNNRLVKLTSAGVYAASITGLASITGVCIDDDDDIYVVYNTTSVRKYSSALALQWTQTGVGTALHSITTDSTHLYITDTTTDLIYKRLCSTGSQWTLQATYGSTGTGNDNFDTPGQVAVDATHAYIADTANARMVKRLLSTGAYVSSITGLTGITGVALDPSGNIYVTYNPGGGFNNTVKKYDSSFVLQWTMGFLVSSTVRHLATDGTRVYLTVAGALNAVYSVLCSTGSAGSTVTLTTTTGSGNDEVDTPWGIGITGGEVYVVDAGNSRVQVFTTAGAYVRQWAIAASSRGIAFDASGDVLVAEYGQDAVKRYTNTGTLIDSFAQINADGIAMVAGDVAWVADADNDTLKKWDEIAPLGASGTGNGQFDTPRGIDTDGTHLWIVDSGNSRVQKITVAGVYVAQWAINAGARGLALDASGDVWVCEYASNQLRRFSEAGVFQVTIAQSTPAGIGIATGDILWVSSGNHSINEWDEATVSDDAVAAKAWLAGYSGTAWCGLWESTSSITPTWMQLSTVGDYHLWWGDTDGVIYYQQIPPPFFNPVSRHTLQVFPYAAEGWLKTVRYDANMTGWDKIASHFFAMTDYAAADVYVDVSYRTDGDAFDALTDADRLDPPWTSWKRVDHTGRTIMWFDDETVDAVSELPRREGLSYQWIQFLFEFFRGGDTYKSPIWTWHSLHHVPVPQDSASLTLTIPLAFDKKVYNRSVDEMAETLMELQTHRGFIWLQTSNPRPSQSEQQVYFRGRVTQVKSEFRAGADNNLTEVMVLNFVELSASSNTFTTEAA